MARIGVGALWAVVAAVFVSGVPLWIWYAPDVTEYRMALPSAGNLVRAIHAASAAVLVVGALVHGIRRRGVGERSGVWAFLAVALAGVTGAWASPGTTGMRLWRFIARPEPSDVGLAGVVLVHVLIAAFIAGALLYVHGSRTAWRVPTRDGILAIALIAFIAWLSPRYEPSIFPNWWWEFPVWVLAPPVTIVWAWSLAAGMLLWARWRFRPTTR